jgi:hypothetical protein
MRRTALYFAGALMATGAAMAIAGPASAATSHSAQNCYSFYCDSYNPQWLSQQAYTSQTAISNSNNPQYGLFNLNAGNGGASNSSITSITGILG